MILFYKMARKILVFAKHILSSRSPIYSYKYIHSFILGINILEILLFLDVSTDNNANKNKQTFMFVYIDWRLANHSVKSSKEDDWNDSKKNGHPFLLSLIESIQNSRIHTHIKTRTNKISFWFQLNQYFLSISLKLKKIINMSLICERATSKSFYITIK